MALYDLVKESKHSNQAMNEIINLFEPKLKKSLSMTHYDQREDLKQELKYRLINYIQKYNVDSIPGFWELKAQLENKELIQ
ncbi:helix-turn-helix domain-containing protein [Rossellomorea marisflavi]|uniref:helix-turn-helix domain-containing protein n=1 Tax=Rossellomorea marisflavi TaxID=189381 RepID=UPI003458399D